MPIPIHGTTFPERRYTGLPEPSEISPACRSPSLPWAIFELPVQPAHLPCPPFGAAVKLILVNEVGHIGELIAIRLRGEVVMTAVFHAPISRRRHRRPHGHGFVSLAFGGNVVSLDFAVSDSPRVPGVMSPIN